MAKDSIRIANCSGYYGDKLSAAKEMVEGGPIDVLTGDYLAELTMAILYSQKLQRGEDKGYVGTFLKQLKDIAKTCKDQKIKIVSNAGGLNPKSMAKEVETILTELDVDATVAYIDGDDLVEELEQLQAAGELLDSDKEWDKLEEAGVTNPWISFKIPYIIPLTLSFLVNFTLIIYSQIFSDLKDLQS